MGTKRDFYETKMSRSYNSHNGSPYCPNSSYFGGFWDWFRNDLPVILGTAFANYRIAWENAWEKQLALQELKQQEHNEEIRELFSSLPDKTKKAMGVND